MQSLHSTLQDHLAKLQEPVTLPPVAGPSTSSASTGSQSAAPGAQASSLNNRFLTLLRDSVSRPSGISSSGRDTGGGGAQKSLKYGKDVLKGLEVRLKSIAKGEDARYRDDTFRRTAAVFWANYSDPDWLRSMKDSRRLEELILHFVTCSSKTVKKSPDILEPHQNAEINQQISKFVRLLSEVVSTQTPTAYDVKERLNSYVQAMQTEEPEAPATPAKDSAALPPSLSRSSTAKSASSGPYVKSLLSVFGDGSDDLTALVKACRVTCTPEIDQGTWTFPAPEDFPDHTSFEHWRARRKEQLQSQLQDIGSVPIVSEAEEFHFRSSDPGKDHNELLRRLLDADLDAMANLPDTEMVPLAILAEEHTVLINRCCEKWAIDEESRAVLFCSILVDLYRAGDIPIECVQEAIQNTMVIEQQMPMNMWKTADAKRFHAALVGLVDSLTSELLQSLREFPALRARDIAETTNLLSQILEYQQENGSSQAGQVGARLGYVIQTAAKQHYRQSIQGNPLTEIPGVVHVAKWLEKEAKLLDKRWPEPILPLREAADFSQIQKSGRPLPDMQDVFFLYQSANKFLDMLQAFAPDVTRSLDPNRVFEPFVYEWFKRMRRDVVVWVENAIEMDNVSGLAPGFAFYFEGHLTGRRTSSHAMSPTVRALLCSTYFHLCIMLLKPCWACSGDLDRDLEILSRNWLCLKKVFLAELQSVQDTAIELQELEAAAAAPTNRAANLLQMASKLSLRDRKQVVPPFNFQATVRYAVSVRAKTKAETPVPKICVKINDVEEAMQQLDRFYWELDIDKFAQGRPVTTAQFQPRQIFSIRIVRADLDHEENLEDTAIKTSVVLSDEKGICVASTRTVADSAFPKWDEVFDIAIDSKMWLMATVFGHEGTEPSTVGRAYFKLDEGLFPEMATKDLWLPLDTHGRLLLKISREKEKEDPQFHFGKAFWVLRKTQEEMTTALVDKMVPTIRACLSRKSLKRLFRKASSGSDALGRIKDVYQKAVSQTASAIPAVKTSLPVLSDVEVESAIGPVLDYFDSNLHVLSASLSSSNLRGVLLRLWNEILSAIEDVIVPPLSDRPSSMRPLRDSELDVVLKWLKFLRDYFHAGGDEAGLPLEELQTQNYHDLMRIRIYYDWRTDDLMEECVRDFQKSLRAYGRGRAKDLRTQRNLGTIKKEREERKRLQNAAGGNGEMIMRVLRMRPGTQEFLQDQLRTLYQA